MPLNLIVVRVPTMKRVCHQRLKTRKLVMSLALLACLTAAEEAWPCSDLPNICEQQQAVFEQNQEMAREAAENYANQRDEEGYGSQSSKPAQRDPMSIRMDLAAGAVFALHAAATDEIERMKNDPKIGPIIRGKWDFFQDANNAKPGQYCAALYMNIAGLVRLSGPGGSYGGALLTFWGPNIPKPRKVRWIKVKLKQVVNNDPNNASTQTVRAYNYTDPKAKRLGVIALAVPSANALLDNMSDHLDFKLEVNGKEVQAMGFHSGLMARDKLRRCISKR